MEPYKIALIGPGKVGVALCNALINKGHTVDFVLGKNSARTRAAAKLLKSHASSTDIKKIPATTNIILITTPGPAIPELAKLLAANRSLPWKKILVIHTSGGDGATVLQALRKLGARVAAIHPIQSFPTLVVGSDASLLLDGITYGYDAPPNAIGAARAFINELNGKAFHVPASSRPLYHALCVFASGYAVQLLQLIEDIRKKLPGQMPWQDIIGPLLMQSITNAFNNSPLNATTGPIVRGDVPTVRAHIAALSKSSPHALAAYKALGLSTVDHLEKSKKLNKKTATQLRKELKLK